jgi:hypothetical protein
VRPKQKAKAKKAKPVTQKEVGLLGQALRALGGSAGGAIGGMFGGGGAPIGAAAGTSLGAAISRWLGAGDYSVSQNSMVQSVKASGSIPSMHMNDQTIIVRHKEFVKEVLSNTTFTVDRAFSINPGNSNLFPWLSNLANNYQQYRIRGMVYHYVPTSGMATGANTALGSVMLQTSYRANDSAPTSKVELLNEYWSSEAMPSEAFCHPIECNPAENPFNVQYVRSTGSSIPTQDSPLLYDLGTTYLATSGQQTSGQVLGDLWVTYEIELKKPILSSNVTNGDILYANQQFSSPSNSNYFGTSVSTVGNFKFTTGDLRTVNIPAEIFGQFWVVLRLKTTSGSPFGGFIMTGAPIVSGCTLVNWSPFSDRYETNQPGVAAVDTATYAFRIKKTQREQTAGLQFPTFSSVGAVLQFAEVTLLGTDNVNV